ncbi:MAG: exopolysaccharide biosynthesis polyprenyl glycosylphosphotransferase [Verrucomicrobiales bacterium]|nr:exopolysaccharide biosynthesis polyprenyl glycosylphosphotransferase [Verrucomicrobiales bacterium]
MFDLRARGLYGLFLLAQMALVTAAFWLWLPATHGSGDLAELPLAMYVTYNAALLVGIAIGFHTERSHDYFGNPTFGSATRNALWQIVFSGGSLFVYLVGTQDSYVSRLFLFTFVPVEYGVLVLSQRYLSAWLARSSFSGHYEQRIALVGSVKRAVALRSWLNSKRTLGYNIIGIVSDDPKQESITGLKVLGRSENFESALQEWAITQVILVGLPQPDDLLHHYTGVCERQGVRLLVACDFEERFRHPVTLIRDGGLCFLALRREPLESPFNRFCKRALDLAVAVPVVVLILPITTFAVWLLQRWQSPGPIFFVQERVGLQNQRFRMMKYRTMQAGNDDEARQVQRDDPRLFPAGRWLRRFSLDELPQFLNVLHGDMSVVGPRPHLAEHNEIFARAMSNYHVRGVVKPGLTGLAQVRGFRGGISSQKDIADRINSDIQYLENWNFALDCWIIARTVAQVVKPPHTAC